VLVLCKHATNKLSFNASFKNGLRWLFEIDVIELVLDPENSVLEHIYNTTLLMRP